MPHHPTLALLRTAQAASAGVLVGAGSSAVGASSALAAIRLGVARDGQRRVVRH